VAKPRNRYLALIGAFRILKSLSLFAAGIGALRLLRPGTVQRLAAWLARFSDHAVVHRALGFVTHLSPQRAELIAAGAFAYGAVMAVEGVGLWMQKKWAEWLTIVVTASFIPFEIVEIARRVTAIRVGLLVANVAILIYLIVRRVRKR